MSAIGKARMAVLAPACVAAPRARAAGGGACGPARPDGFTLLEMLVVLAIAGLIAGIAFPAIERASASIGFRLGVARTVGAIGDARARAISHALPVRFTPDMAGPLPPQVSVRVEQGPLVFFGDGSATRATVTITGATRRQRYAVEPMTGALESQP